MIVGSACLSHSPMLDRNRADAGVEARFGAACAEMSSLVEAWRPDVTIVFYPDHFNGFSYGLMPAFCIGTAADSVGDYGSTPGRVDVPEDLAVDLAGHVLASGVDTALSYRMRIDHGAIQPIEIIAEGAELGPIIPVFINCAAAPRPGFSRVRALGEAVGRWAVESEKRVLIVGSGGLSHDPPMPMIKGAAPAVRERLISDAPMTQAARFQRQKRVFAVGRDFAAGAPVARALDPAWDQAFLAAMMAGRLDHCDGWSDEAVTQTGGAGGHEVRCWLAAFAALSVAGPYAGQIHFYEPIPEWLTGMALATGQTVA